MRRTNYSNVVMALDPSGNFTEGKGTTGWCVSNNGYIFAAGQIYAAEYNNQMEYWDAVMTKIAYYYEQFEDDFQIVCEDYRLYASASEAQINSNLETPQLIGAIKYMCHISDIKITMQMAAEVKQRWSDEVLYNKKLINKIGRDIVMGNLKLSNHSLDAVRHCMHFNIFKLKIRDDHAENDRSREPQRKTSFIPRKFYSNY